ncbi:SGNH hydrolase-type esterase domain-containing protein [Aspergillus filifer]
MSYSFSQRQNSTTSVLSLPRADNTNPADFRWIERWAAIGDSFTAGIGSGQLYSRSKGDRQCSRYDRSYPAILERRLGPSVKVFEYLACNGDRTNGIFQQALSLQKDMDLVVLTAGGNDLCLSAILTTCIFLPFQGEKACQSLLDNAQENINTILKPNIRQILDALNSKMKKDGIVIFSRYAQYFNTEDNECGDRQDWSFPPLAAVKGLQLTIERRKKFNNLVENINTAIKEVVNEYRKNSWIKYRIRYTKWDDWVKKAVKGQFCVPGTSRDYPDPMQPDLQFFRPSLKSRVSDHDELKVRGPIAQRTPDEADIQDDEAAVFNSLLYKSANPAALALNILEPRAPIPPGCPGDDKGSYGIGLPDRWGKWFHPNELGHRTIASFALEAVIAERAAVLLVPHPTCKRNDYFNCYQNAVTNNRYVSADTLERTHRIYCKEMIPREGNDWSDERTFYDGTPDAHKYRMRYRTRPGDYTEEGCVKAFQRLIHGCNPPNIARNPMNFKFGGTYEVGPFLYELVPVGTIRPWPLIEKPYGKCEGNYENEMSTYTFYGAGWASWDHGRKTIYKSMVDCVGWSTTGYKFKYFHIPDKDGFEWKMSVHWPSRVKHCFRNDKVQKEAGGTTGGCSGSD